MESLYENSMRNLRYSKDSKFAIWSEYDRDVNDTAHIKCVRELTLKC